MNLMNHPSVLINANELAALPESTALIVDCRFDLADPEKGGREFRDAHIPDAVYANLDRDLSDLSKPGLGRHPLPDEQAFSQTLSRWGWTKDQRTVCYDDNGGALAAARLWWLLSIAGIEAGVLDGGWRAWCDAGLPVERGAGKSCEPTAVDVHFDPQQTVFYEELESLRATDSMLLLDARAAPRFRGEVEPIDAKAGHVPGALNRPFGENLDASGRFKSRQALRDEFTALLQQTLPRDVVHMCGSGVTAAHNLLAMEAAGLHGSRLFAPSWSGYICDSRRSIASGE